MFDINAASHTHKHTHTYIHTYNIHTHSLTQYKYIYIYIIYMSQFSLDANGGRGGVNFRTAAEAALAYARFLVRIFSKKKSPLWSGFAE